MTFDTRSIGRLSVRQKEIVSLMAEGLDRGEIARKLVISPRTVDAHLSTSYRTLGVSCSSQAVILWYHRIMLDLGVSVSGSPADPATTA